MGNSNNRLPLNDYRFGAHHQTTNAQEELTQIGSYPLPQPVS